jgi:hypothetical protein
VTDPGDTDRPDRTSRSEDATVDRGPGADTTGRRLVAGLLAGGSTKPLLALVVVLLLLMALGFLVAGLLVLL